MSGPITLMIVILTSWGNISGILFPWFVEGMRWYLYMWVKYIGLCICGACGLCLGVGFVLGRGLLTLFYVRGGMWFLFSVVLFAVGIFLCFHWFVIVFFPFFIFGFFVC